MSQTPNLEDVIMAAIAQRLNSFVTASVAKVIAYDNDTQRVDIEIAIVNQEEGQDGEPVPVSWPQVHHVPVVFPGSGDYRITFPVNTGDWVLYVVTTLPIGDWFKSGGSVALNEDTAARNNKRSGFVIPGLFTAKHVPTKAPTNALVVHSDHVKLGSVDASELVALKKDILALRYALQTAPIVVGGGGASAVVDAADTIATILSGGPGTMPPDIEDGVWPIGSTKVEVE